jgi:hypothetical protein
MKRHPLLSNPKVVLISRIPVGGPLRSKDYRRVGWLACSSS